MAIIRHPQLSKMTDKKLYFEFSYLITQIGIRQEQIKYNVIMLSAGSIPIWPTWKLIEDLVFLTDYLHAVVDEYHFRYIP